VVCILGGRQVRGAPRLSPASTPAMSMFKTAGSLLLVRTDALVAEMGGEEVAGGVVVKPAPPTPLGRS
jgi:hypothetical protein